MFGKMIQYTQGNVVIPAYLAKLVMLTRERIVETVNAYLAEHPAEDGHILNLNEDTIFSFEDKSLTADFIASVDAQAHEVYGGDAVTLTNAMNLPDLVIEFDFSAKPVYIPADPALYAALGQAITKLFNDYKYMLIEGKKVCGWMRPLNNGKWFEILN